MPYYGPVGETPTEILLERAYLASGFLAGVGYGIFSSFFVDSDMVLILLSPGTQLAVFAATVRCLLQSRNEQGRHLKIGLLAYITVLFILNSLYAAFTARGDELNYIDDRNYPGGPVGYFNNSGNVPVNLGAQIVYFLGTFFADALQVNNNITLL